MMQEKESAQREILFKARRVDNGEWVEGDLLHSYFKKGDTCICCPDWTNIKRVAPATLCQCSNKTDKNGVKVFDGDIYYDYARKCNVIVSYSDDLMCWILVGDGWDSLIESGEFEHLTAIGSIHTTPELMVQSNTPHADPLEAGTRRGER